MSEVAIEKLRLDSDGRLRLRPTNPSAYPYIHRDASSVRWDENNRELHVLEVPGFDALAEFKQIIGAVAREYGDRLVLSSITDCTEMPDELIAEFGKFIDKASVRQTEKTEFDAVSQNEGSAGCRRAAKKCG